MFHFEYHKILIHTVGTNGKDVGEVEFSADNCTYFEEEGKINIKVKNTKQLVNFETCSSTFTVLSSFQANVNSTSLKISFSFPFFKVKNTKQLVNVNQSEEYLKIEGDMEQEERYYSRAGIDESISSTISVCEILIVVLELYSTSLFK